MNHDDRKDTATGAGCLALLFLLAMTAIFIAWRGVIGAHP